MSTSSSITSILPLEVETVLSSGETASSGIHRVPLCGARAAGSFKPRKFEVKAGATARTAEYFDRTAMFLHDTVADRKAEAGALAGGLGSEERIVDAVQVLWSDAVAGIDHVDARAAVIGCRLHFQHSPSLHGVPRIEEQIQKHLLQLSRIAVHRGQCWLESRTHFDARLFHLMLDQRKSFLDYAVKIHFAELGRRGPREVQQAVDDFAGAEGLLSDLLEHARFLLILGHLLGQHLRVTG